MRNLTKVLALVLSLAFVMTMFAGAINLVPKYSDSADLSAAGDEAVSVLSALDIVDGYLDGSYQGSKAVTRAEYAKLIAIASNGYDATPFYDTTSVNFVDAVDAWALPYVNYCYLTGILAGYTDGTVKAANAVKGVEAIKMTLVALGYNPVIEGLVGANWVENTVTLARRAGLLVNLEAKNLYAEFDREATAILVYNALYADVVEYVGNTATATGATLGEDAFDLLDVTAIVVANDGKALGNVYSDLMVKDDKATAMYLEYDVAKKDTTTVVYRAYVADTKGGYFTPVVLNLAIDTNDADLGKVYRILTTNANAAAGRTVYGVLEAAPNGLTTTYAQAIAAKDFAAMIDKMEAKAAAAHVASPKNVMINNAFATFAEVEAWFAANAASNSPVVMIDNNTDGTVDTLKVYTRSYGEVVDVTETHYFVKWSDGVKSYKIADTAFELVEGDWLSNDALKGMQKLATVSGMVTAIGSSITLNGVTVYTGVASAWTNASKIVAALGGQPGVNATIWYDADGKAYAVDGKLDDAASWANYGIVTGWSDDVLGMQTVRIFDANNTYKTYVVTSINGLKEYDQYLNSFWWTVGVNELVKYYVDGNTVALYTYDNALMIGEKVTNGTASYTTKYDEWTITSTVDKKTTTNVYNWDNGYIFATAKMLQPATDEKADYIWRAYKHDEFQPWLGYYAGEFKGVVDSLNNNLKVGAIYAPEYVLPGLVLGNDQWLTMLAAPKLVFAATEDGKTTYTYELTYAVANGQPNTKATTQIVSDLPLFTGIEAGDIIRATFDENNNVTYWVQAFRSFEFVPGSNGIELAKLTLDYAREDAKGVVDVKVIDIDTNANGVHVDLFGQWLKLADECDFYLINNIGTADIAINTDVNDYYGSWVDVLNRAAAKNYAVYADINMATAEINAIWIDAKNVQAQTTVVDGSVTLTKYDEVAGKATYEVVTKTTDWKVAKYVDVVDVATPDLLLMNVGETVDAKVTVQLNVADAGEYKNTIIGWKEANDKFATYTLSEATGVQDIVWTDDYKIEVYAGSSSSLPTTTYTLGDVQIWWYRPNMTWNNRLDAAATSSAWNVDDQFYIGAGDAINNYLVNSKLDDNFTGKDVNGNAVVNSALNYESVILVNTDADADIDIIVLVDTSKTDSTPGFPYDATAR